ncbi:uncharacterized protein Z520_02460 [Fonsecaea multimorphosa CBS 102226]|uniref:Deubiquitination-protection protein dph1 n=1 Tax=Fonsecaea multimorphosa CBS 102226 TaxID=1442371 RepID=A0A0D2IZ45_9EURO|nr:uncharacterized protein Z520_02460 [Fonsecaea multimorphosa CBS 102226]KIY02322.1 hypothetical protein Z520_02460 [Fonsecaea multimorphosa CBS 102226]OAL28966.1 hypothetical protein AYO22_02402 [Fonsecaea multimorphosa]
MADAAGAEDATVTFHVKSSGSQKWTLTLPLSTTTLDLKNKLASEEYANVPASAQRLIYSGKVLKDHETLASHNVKEGNTMHLVKSAASNQRQNPATQSSSTSTPAAGATPQAVPGVPQNLASGTGNDPLAGLTGARYAGFSQLPNPSMFQENLTPDDFLRQLDNPHFQQMMREAMGNPQVQDMIINQNPHLRAMGPQARQMLNSDYFRSMMTNPQMLRNMMQMQQQMGMGPFGGAAGGEAFPAPGVTNTTEQGTNGGTPQNAPSDPPGMPPSWGRATQPGEQLLSLLQQMRDTTQALADAYGDPNTNATGARSGEAGSNNQAGGQQPQTADNMTNQTQQRMNPFMALFPPQGRGPNTTSPPPLNPFNPQQNPFLQNPEAMQQFLQEMNAGQGGQGGEGMDYGGLFNMLGAGRPTSPPDNRPPEERYAQQLQQLNEMGFYDFDRNVQALRRTGGNVNGAIEYLLSHPAD